MDDGGGGDTRLFHKVGERVLEVVNHFFQSSALYISGGSGGQRLCAQVSSLVLSPYFLFLSAVSPVCYIAIFCIRNDAGRNGLLINYKPGEYERERRTTDDGLVVRIPPPAALQPTNS